jgi:hypothetical protein
MATDGPTPPPCDDELHKHGIAVMMADLSSNRMEKFVTIVRKASGQKVDWFYMGGRAVVLALGDLDKVREALKKHLPMFKELRKEYLISEHIDPKFFDEGYKLY